MAVNSPGSYHNFKSPRSPRHLPQPPSPQPQQQQQQQMHQQYQQQLSGQRSPSLSHNLGRKSPSTPRVFEFPPERRPATTTTTTTSASSENYDFDVFTRSNESLSDSRSSLLPESYATGSTSTDNSAAAGDFCPSPTALQGHRRVSSGAKSPIFQFCTRKKPFAKTLSYPPKSPVSASPTTTTTPPSMRAKSPNSAGPQLFPHKTTRSLFQHAQGSSCFNLGRAKNPLSPTTGSGAAIGGFPHFGGNPRVAGGGSTPKLSSDDYRECEARNEFARSESGGGGGGGSTTTTTTTTSESGKQSRRPKVQPLRLDLAGAAGESSSAGGGGGDNFARHERNREPDSPRKLRSERMGSLGLNRSHGCLKDASLGDGETSFSGGGGGCGRRNSRNTARKSTSDLTGLNANEAETEVAILASPRRRGSMKGGLAYLASRRGSRDSQASNVSNVSNEDIGPLNFSAHPRGRQRRTSNFLELPVPDHIRPRVHSLPEKAYNPRAGDDLYRLRAFSITHKGVVNRGDSIISRRSRSNTSVNSSRNSNVSGERSPFEGSCCSGQGVAADSTESDVEEIPKYRVVLLGDSGVGKTALVSQFMTSEYMNTYDASLDDEFGEKTVSILLDGEESEMVFIDHPHVEMSVENSLSTYEPHACIVVYSIVSRASFQVAEETLNYLWREHFTQDRSVIVVGNKSDLARSRKITANEGKQLATSRECKFIETSSGIQHNVDELLVGVLKQIRLRETRDKKLRRQGSKGKMLSKLHGSKTALSLNLAKDILNKMCLNDSKSKSCENLHVLSNSRK